MYLSDPGSKTQLKYPIGYGALLDSLNAALRKSSYPWCVLVFTSSYGDGAHKYLWQADSKASFLRAGDRAAVLTAVLGKHEARKMLADWKRCLALDSSCVQLARSEGRRRE